MFIWFKSIIRSVYRYFYPIMQCERCDLMLNSKTINKWKDYTLCYNCKMRVEKTFCPQMYEFMSRDEYLFNYIITDTYRF